MNQDNKWNWNRNAWTNYLENCNIILPEEKVEQLPSILWIVFNDISNIILNYDVSWSLIEYNIPFEIENKIDYNNVKKYKVILEEYGTYLTPVETYLNWMDENTPWRKNKLLKKIRLLYLDILFNLNKGWISNIDFIKKDNNSDLIIDEIKSLIFSKYNTFNNNNTISQEDLEISIIVILCKAFTECKILENPNNI